MTTGRTPSKKHVQAAGKVRTVRQKNEMVLITRSYIGQKRAYRQMDSTHTTTQTKFLY